MYWGACIILAPGRAHKRILSTKIVNKNLLKKKLRLKQHKHKQNSVAVSEQVQCKSCRRLKTLCTGN